MDIETGDSMRAAPKRGTGVERRDLLKAGVFAGAALTLPVVRSVGAAAPPKLAASKLPKPFTMPFKRLPDAVPAHQDATTDYFEIDEIAAQAEIIPGYKSWVYSYGGSVPGPTIHATRDRQTVVRFRNRLPEFHPTLGYESWTSVHLHGGNSLPQFDGYASDITRPGEYKDYHYLNDETGRTIWYHDHGMHHTAENAYHGLAGMYVIHDPVEEAAFPDEVFVPPGRERPLLLHVHEARLGLPRLDEGDPRQPHAKLLHADHDARPRAHRRGPLDDAHLLVRGSQALEDAGIAVKVPDGALRNAGKVQGEFERRHAFSTPQNERSI